MSKTSFQLVYDGPALTANEIAVRDLAPALMAMDIVFREADVTLNNGRTESSLMVKASFKTGCFKVDFVSAQEWANKIKDLLNSQEITAILNASAVLGIAAGLWKLIKWLRGRSITKTEMALGKIRVWVSDHYLDVEKETIELFRNHKLREALDQAVSPLDVDGIETMAIMQDGEVVAEVSKEERRYFSIRPLPEIYLEDKYRETHLRVISPSFQGGDKWRVNDGGSNFYVTVNDQEFVEKVLRDQVQFSASTLLKVNLREVQYTDSKANIKKDCTVEKVLEIINPAEQMDFGFANSP